MTFDLRAHPAYAEGYEDAIRALPDRRRGEAYAAGYAAGGEFVGLLESLGAARIGPCDFRIDIPARQERPR